MAISGRIRSLRTLTLVAAAVAMALGTLMACQQWQPALLAKYYQGKLAMAADEQEIAGIFQRLLQLDDAGLPVVVDSLADQRQPIARQARTQLLVQMQSWETLPADVSGQRFAALVHVLSERGERFSPSARQLSSELAVRVLAVPLDYRHTPPALLADCRRILERGTEAGDMNQGLGVKEKQVATEPAKPLQIATATARRASIEDVVRLPGGGLPVELANRESTLVMIAPNAAATSKSHSLPAVDRDAQIPRPLVKSDDARPIIANSVTAPQLPNALAERESPRMIVNAPVTSPWRVTTEAPRELTKLPVREVIELLQNADDPAAERIRRELTRRGMSGLELSLARRLADPDSSRRKQLAELLPSLPGVDAKPWLLWLLRDENSEVRLAAGTIMLTSGDPEMLAWVREQSVSDPQLHLRLKPNR